MNTKHRVVIVGGGFAGLNAAVSLRNMPVEVTLIDRRNFHLFQPLLYQVATGGLSPGDISSPLRYVLRKYKHIRVVLGEVTAIDAEYRKVIADGDEFQYDTLIVATGASHSYFGHDEWNEVAPGLKTVEDAIEMRHRIFQAFESAEREHDDENRKAWQTFAIVGGGPTGVELAGALGELANDTLRDDFRAINPKNTKVLLLEGGERILPGFPPDLSEKAKESLRQLGVTVRTKTFVTNVSPDGVTVQCNGESEFIPARTILWAAGVRASKLGRMIADQTGCETDKIGRVVVNPDLSVANHSNIFVLGDLALFKHQTGEPLPGIAPVAMQQGWYIGKLIKKRLRGDTPPPFHYFDKGILAVIGRASAVADLKILRFSGYPAWLIWLFVHLMYLVDFENRVLVFIQWGWSYVTRNRGARLITGQK